MLQVLAMAASAFAATNLDDLLLLLLFFTAAADQRNGWLVVAGQYLGFTFLVGASLLGYLGGQLFPDSWIGVLGLLPIGLGVSQLLDTIGESDDHACSSEHPVVPAWLARWSLPGGQLFAVAAITLANGADNVGVYTPLFSQCSPPDLLITLLAFVVLVAVWCGLAWSLVQSPPLARAIQRYGQPLAPLVLIVLGFLILIDSHAFADRALAVLVLTGLLALAVAMQRQLQQSLHFLRRIAVDPSTISLR